MSLLKEAFNSQSENKELAKDYLNVIDTLSYESALNDFQNCYKEFNQVNIDLTKTLEIQDNISNNLTNESALSDCLNKYGYLTNEEATNKTQALGEQALREIKDLIKRMVEKFIGLFKQLKEHIIKIFTNNDSVIKSLYKSIDKLGESKKVYSLDHESFNQQLPTIKDFGNNSEIHEMLNKLTKSAVNLKSYGTQASLFKSPHFDANQEDLIECSKNRISYLTSDKNGKLKISSEDMRFKESELKSRLLNKDNLKAMLNKVSLFDDTMKRYIDDLDFLTGKLNKVDGLRTDALTTHPHLTNNIRVTLEANGKFSNNIIYVTKGVLFVIASNIKCYENN